MDMAKLPGNEPRGRGASRTEAARGSRLPNAPLMPLAATVAAGVVADRFVVACSTLTWTAIALGCALIAAIALRRFRALGITALLLSWLALGGGWHHHRWSDLGPDDLARSVSEEPRLAWLRGVVWEVPAFRPAPRPDDPGSTRTVLAVSAVSDGVRWHQASGRVSVVITGDRTDLKAGALVSAAGSLSAVAGPLNPGEFDYRDYLRAQGIRLRLAVNDPQSIWAERDSSSAWHDVPRALTQAIGAARAWSYAKLVSGLDPAIAPVAAALLLGRREAVEPDVNDAFARTGTMHLLAISGLHLQVLAGVLFLVFRTFGLPRSRSFLAVALATLGYALLVGLAPSVVRSAAMTVMVCVASMRDRYVRATNALALAALVTLLLNPAHLFDVGCQLSFLAVGAIAWGVAPVLAWLPAASEDRAFDSRLRRNVKRCAWVFAQGVVVSLVVWLVTQPLVSLRFHVASPIGIALNIPLIPITSLALLAAGLTLALAAIWGPMAGPLAWLCSALLRLTEQMVRWGSAQKWGHAFLPGPPLAWVLAFYGLLAFAALASAARQRQARWAWAALCGWVVFGFALTVLPARPGALEADVLAVGHGLAVVIQTADGHAFVYDCGRMGDSTVGRRVIAPALWARGVRTIDAVILSHADVDHYNGLPDLLDRFAVSSLRVAPGFASARNPGASRLLALARSRGVTIAPIAAGDRWTLGLGALATVLHPARGWQPGASDNDHSVTIDLASDGRHLLLTGDLEQVGQTDLSKQPAEPFDAVLAPHHGGRTANPPWFYDWARPAKVVVSQRRPVAGTSDALAFLEARGVAVLRTWQRGAIRLRWEPAELRAHGFLDEPVESRNQGLSFFPVATGYSWQRLGVSALALALGLALCLALAVIEWGAWVLVRPGRRLAANEPEPAPWQPIEARAADGVRLVGAWRPVKGAQKRTVVLLHGFAEDRSALRDRAEALAARGWNVVLPDARGHGQSEGDHASFGGREADDLRAWLDALAGRIGSPPAVVAWGRSMGAAVALRAAAADPRIAALVLEAPYPDLELAVAGWLARYRVPRRLASPLVGRAAALAGVSLSRPRPIELAALVRAPVLILHGSDDPIVPLSEARRLAAAFPVSAQLIEIQGARHADVLQIGGPELIERIIVFLDEVMTMR
jgi:competence protein ComEC